jgi:hypothetical protein
VIILASVAAAAASIAVGVAVANWRQRNLTDRRVETDLRGVQDVLADCYRKINDIERELPVGSVVNLRSDNVVCLEKTSRMMFNGNPAMGN